MYIIFGASGFLGAYFYDYLKNKVGNVTGTYKNHKKENLIYFDLNDIDNNIDVITDNNINYAIICSYETKIDNAGESLSSELNTKSTMKLIKVLASNKIIPVFISSDNVFEGSKKLYSEEDLCRPVNCYGRQKLEVENFIKENLKEYLIIRLSKIHSHSDSDDNWLYGWIYKLSKGKQLNCATDQFFSPTFVMDSVQAVYKLINRGCRGVYHIASDERLSKFELGLKICELLKFSNDLINPVKINNLGLKEKRPLNTCLDTGKFHSEFDYAFHQIRNSIIEIGSKLRK